MTFGTGNLTQGTDPFVAVKQFELTAIFHSVRTEEFWLEERRCSIEGNGNFYLDNPIKHFFHLETPADLQLRYRLHLYQEVQ